MSRKGVARSRGIHLPHHLADHAYITSRRSVFPSCDETATERM